MNILIYLQISEGSLAIKLEKITELDGFKDKTARLFVTFLFQNLSSFLQDIKSN